MRVNVNDLKLSCIKKEDDYSKLVNDLVDDVVRQYSGALDTYIESLLETLKTPYTLSNDQVEDITLRVPLYLYIIASGLETLGVDGDVAKFKKQEVHNEAYMAIEGTIQDKTKYAELRSTKEQVIEMVFSRAYKKLKLKLDATYAIHSSAKKILSKRMIELEIHKFDKGVDKVE